MGIKEEIFNDPDRIVTIVYNAEMALPIQQFKIQYEAYVRNVGGDIFGSDYAIMIVKAAMEHLCDVTDHS